MCLRINLINKLHLNKFEIFYSSEYRMPRTKRRGSSNTNVNTPFDMSMPSAHDENLPRHPAKRLRSNNPRYIYKILFLNHIFKYFYIDVFYYVY